MNFRIGDEVSILDNNLNGKIISLTSYKAIIIDKYGFEEEYPLNKLVLVSKEEEYETSFSDIPFNKEKEIITKYSKKNISREVKEIDLHMENLSENTRGMTNHEIVMYQLNAVEKALRSTDKRRFHKIVFIHGIGQGKLRYELEILLKEKKIYFQDASFKTYGRGAIEVLL